MYVFCLWWWPAVQSVAVTSLWIHSASVSTKADKIHITCEVKKIPSVNFNPTEQKKRPMDTSFVPAQLKQQFKSSWGLEDRHYLQQHPVNLPQWWRCESAALCVTLLGCLTPDLYPFLFLSSGTGSGDTGRTGICCAMRRKWKGCSRRSSWLTGGSTLGWCSRNSCPRWRSLCPRHGSDSPPVKLNCVSKSIHPNHLIIISRIDSFRNLLF